jgi:hypothetical protein
MEELYEYHHFIPEVNNEKYDKINKFLNFGLEILFYFF